MKTNIKTNSNQNITHLNMKKILNSLESLQYGETTKIAQDCI